MRLRFLGGTLLLVLITAMAPSSAMAQGGAWNGNALGYAPPNHPSPLPLYSTRPESGGLFFSASAVFYRQTSPLEDQVVALRGFFDLNQGGRYIGNGDVALDTGQVDGGPGNVQFGFRTSVGYRLGNGGMIELSWVHLTKNEFSALASLIPANLAVNQDASNTFLSAGVFNFPIDFAGPIDNDTDVAGVSTFGIWNAADLMIITFEQRNEFIDLLYRQPIHETENHRSYGFMGASFAWFWERFSWRTVDDDTSGTMGGPVNQALYTNIISNRMYGPKIGIGHERYLGHGFALSCDVYASLYFDIAKIRFKYERGDKYAGPERKRALTDYTLAPGLNGAVNLWWYPIEGVQMRLGYNIMTFFNTFASPQPIDFNYSAVNPGIERVFRLLDGVEFGIALIF